MERVDFLSLAGECEDALQLQALLKECRPDLLFLDLEMPYLSGLDLLAVLDRPPKVILTTAYERYALRGYELDVVDYLLKPISFARFLKAVNKARYRLLRENEPVAEESFFFVKHDKRMVKIFLKEILFVEAMENYVCIYTSDSQPVLTRSSLRHIEERLPADSFLRTHKSYIVQVDKVDSVEGNMLRIGDYRIPVARDLRPEIFRRILRNTL